MAAASLTYRENLIALFAGEIEEGVMITRPCYKLVLCAEIARQVDPQSEIKLREAIYGTARPADSIPSVALQVIHLAYTNWVAKRAHQGNRGL